MPTPETPADGYGEYVRALRVYTGLSQREMVRRIGMDRRTYQRIENEAEQCPRGFVDTMLRVVEEFDEAVETTTAAAERMLTGDEAMGAIHFQVDTDNDALYWERAVIGRAAVESGLIMPIMVGTKEAQAS